MNPNHPRWNTPILPSTWRISRIMDQKNTLGVKYTGTRRINWGGMLTSQHTKFWFQAICYKKTMARKPVRDELVGYTCESGYIEIVRNNEYPSCYQHWKIKVAFHITTRLVLKKHEKLCWHLTTCWAWSITPVDFAKGTTVGQSDN